MKKLNIVLLISGVLILGGCGTTTTTTSTTTAVTFDKFVIDIQSTFKPVETSTLETRQIVNKIIKAFVQKKTGFDTNVIIAHSDVSAGVTSLDFSDINKAKLTQDLAGYRPKASGTLSFDCGGRTIQGYTHMFDVIDSLVDDAKKTYSIIQYYFVENGIGYVLSMATQDSTDITAFEGYLESLRCVKK